MLRHLSVLFLMLACAGGCSGDADGDEPKDRPGEDGGTDDPTERDGGHRPSDPPPMNAPAMTFELDGFASYAPSELREMLLQGHVRPSDQLATLTLAGNPLAVDGAGAFSQAIPLTPGVNAISLVATDDDGRTAKLARSVIVADYLPEGSVNPIGMSVPLTTDLVRSLSAPLGEDIAAIDIAGEIAARDELSRDDQCVTVPDGAHSEATQFDLTVNERGEVWLELRVPRLDIGFSGECRGIVRQIPVHGSIATDVVIRSQLTLTPGDTCAAAIAHSPVEVELPGFEMDVAGEGLGGILITLFGSSREDAQRELFASEIATRAEALLTEKLTGLDFFPEASQVHLFGRDVSVKRCVTGIGIEGGLAVARVGTVVRGAGTREAPGAPMSNQALPAARADAMWLDTQMLGQLMFSAYRDGGLDVANLDDSLRAAVLAVVAPGLAGRYDNESPVVASTRAMLPPVVRAATVESGGDLEVELAELIVELRVEGELVFELSTNAHLLLDLVPDGDDLIPVLRSSSVVATVVSEPLADGADGALENSIAMRLPDAAERLLMGTRLRVPTFGGALHALDVQPDPGGRYLAILTKR